MAFKTLQPYHFKTLPEETQEKAEQILQDISPLGILYEGTIDAVDVWGKDDILMLMQAMYNEAKRELMRNMVEGKVRPWDEEIWVDKDTLKDFDDGEKVNLIILKKQ